MGGHGSCFFSLLKAPSESGIDHIPIFFGVEPLRAEYQKVCEDLNLDYRMILKKPRSYWIPQIELLRALLELKADGVVVHSSSSLPAAWLYRLLHLKTALIFVEHQPNHQKTGLEWAMSYVAPSLCHKVVYLTKASQHEIASRIGTFFRSSRAVVIPNGIDTDFFSPTPARENGEFRVGMAARMNKLKAQESLIRALALDEHGGSGIRLFLAGDGPTRPGLEALATELKVDQRVTFLGMLDEVALKVFFNSLDLYAHSTLGETMSTSIMQAQSCGLPVVASDVPGVSNQIENGKDGLLVPPSDPEALYRAIVQIRDDRDLRVSLSTTSRNKAQQRYSQTAMREAYDRALLNLKR